MGVHLHRRDPAIDGGGADLPQPGGRAADQHDPAGHPLGVEGAVHHVAGRNVGGRVVRAGVQEDRFVRLPQIERDLAGAGLGQVVHQGKDSALRPWPRAQRRQAGLVHVHHHHRARLGARTGMQALVQLEHLNAGPLQKMTRVGLLPQQCQRQQDQGRRAAASLRPMHE